MFGKRTLAVCSTAMILGCIPEPRLRVGSPDASLDVVGFDGRAADSLLIDVAAADHGDGAASGRDEGPAADREDVVPATDAVDVFTTADVDGCDAAGHMEAGCAVPEPPRLRSPLASALVSGGQPRLRWELPPGVTSVQLSICADRSCAREVRSHRVEGTEYRISSPLARGTWFWRVRAVVGATVSEAASATWSFVVVGEATRDVWWDGISDIDGDGRAELVVGAPDAEGGSGRVYIYSAGSLQTPRWVIAPPAGAGARFGSRVSVIGDVNGDGTTELAIVAGAGVGDGSTVTVVHGGSGPSGTAATVYRGSRANERFGLRLLRAGDLNGDGFADWAVTYATVVNVGVTIELLYGSESGSLRRGDFWLPPRAGYNFSRLFGAADLDDDGDSDLISGGGVTSLSMMNPPPGYVAVARGGARGVDVASPAIIDGPTGESAFGLGGTVPGDWNGDGYLDVLVGTANNTSTVARLFLGSASGIQPVPHAEWFLDNTQASIGFQFVAATDLNADGRPEWLREQFAREPPSADAPAGWQIVYPGPSGRISLSTRDGLFPLGAVSATADLTGDGIADLAIGHDEVVDIFAGRAGGPSTTPTLTIRSPVASPSGFGSVLAR